MIVSILSRKGVHRLRTDFMSVTVLFHCTDTVVRTLVSYCISSPGVKSGIQFQGTDKMLSPERPRALISRKANYDLSMGIPPVNTVLGTNMACSKSPKSEFQ